MVAILNQEPERKAFYEAIAAADRRLVSAVRVLLARRGANRLNDLEDFSPSSGRNCQGLVGRCVSRKAASLHQPRPEALLRSKSLEGRSRERLRFGSQSHTRAFEPLVESAISAEKSPRM
ncbi:MAG: type II toxin-antitoxin system VapC family toxin [Hyphomicrobiales bacterium]|nr:type II toxin-antitoxin system VapC family toxin [Hyphomicrobiales bacterium]